MPGYTTTASYTKAPVGTLFEAQEPESFTGGFAGQPLVVQQNGQFARPRPGPMTQYPESFTGSSSSPYGRAMGMAPGQPIVIHADTNGYAPTARAPVTVGQAQQRSALVSDDFAWQRGYNWYAPLPHPPRVRLPALSCHVWTRASGATAPCVGRRTVAAP